MNHPEQARKLEDALEVTEPFPEEQAQKRVRRREAINSLIRRIFYKEVWGKQVLNRRALTFIIFFTIFGIVATSWSVMLFRRPISPVRALAATVTNSVPVISSTEEPEEVAQPDSGAATLVVPEVTPSQTQSSPPRELPPYPGKLPPAPTDTFVPPDQYAARADTSVWLSKMKLYLR